MSTPYSAHNNHFIFKKLLPFFQQMMLYLLCAVTFKGLGFMILKKVSYTHQDCTHLIKTNIAKYYYNLKKVFYIKINVFV